MLQLSVFRLEQHFVLPVLPKQGTEGNPALQCKTQLLLKPPDGFSCANKMWVVGWGEPTFSLALASCSKAGLCACSPAWSTRKVGYLLGTKQGSCGLCCSCKPATRKTGKASKVFYPARDPPACLIPVSAPSPQERCFSCPVWYKQLGKGRTCGCTFGELPEASASLHIELLLLQRLQGLSWLHHSPGRRQCVHSQPAQRGSRVYGLDLEGCPKTTACHLPQRKKAVKVQALNHRDKS